MPPHGMAPNPAIPWCTRINAHAHAGRGHGTQARNGDLTRVSKILQIPRVLTPWIRRVLARYIAMYLPSFDIPPKQVPPAMTPDIARLFRRFPTVPSLVLAVVSLQLIAASDSAKPQPSATSPFMATATGLKYRILRKAAGRKPTAADTVTVHYRGWLNDGREFDNSYKRSAPSSFSLERVIRGWAEGVQLVSEGGVIELEIPPQLGYGSRGDAGAIPPMATLHYQIELIQIQ